MTTDRLITLLPLISINCFLVMGIVRSVMLAQRGIRSRVRDPERPRATKVLELGTRVVFWSWIVLIVVFTWPRMSTWMPHWMTFQLIDSPIARWIGAALVVIPVLVYPITLAEMGNSWRIGIDRKAHDPAADNSSRRPPSTLITHGLFRFARNPIYVIVDMVFLGTFLIHGRAVFLTCFILFAFLIHLQILREERFLAERYGEQFEEYRGRVRRYGIL